MHSHILYPQKLKSRFRRQYLFIIINCIYTLDAVAHFFSALSSLRLAQHEPKQVAAITFLVKKCCVSRICIGYNCSSKSQAVYFKQKMALDLSLL